MFCSKCGIELPINSNFCNQYGKPQKEGISDDEVKWETCEIMFGENEHNQRYFTAKTLGPYGVGDAGWRGGFFSGLGQEAQDCHRKLLNNLIKD